MADDGILYRTVTLVDMVDASTTFATLETAPHVLAGVRSLTVPVRRLWLWTCAGRGGA